MDAGLLQLAAARCRLDRFQAPDEGAPLLRLERVAELPPGERIALDGQAPERAGYCVRGDRLLAAIPDEPFAAEAALRALFQLAFLRQGALLLHGAGVAWGERALVATGPSGAGKSTLARLCHQAGAVVLSDETVALDPAGKVFGTPFRSDPELACERLEAELAAIVCLEKGSEEKLVLLRADRAAAYLLGQAYRPAPEAAGRGELLRVASSLAARPGMHQLTFRKHPEAGGFVARWIEGDARA